MLGTKGTISRCRGVVVTRSGRRDPEYTLCWHIANSISMAVAKQCPCTVTIKIGMPDDHLTDGVTVQGSCLLAKVHSHQSTGSLSHPTSPRNELSACAGIRLLVATFFCLLWNISGMLIIVSSTQIYVQNPANRDVSYTLTIVLTAVPFIFVGSVLLWLVMAEWWKYLKGLKWLMQEGHSYEAVVRNEEDSCGLSKPCFASCDQ